MSALPYNKISCSLNNSAAIGENGEIYVWGSGKYGLTYSLDTETRVNDFSPQFKKNPSKNSKNAKITIF